MTEGKVQSSSSQEEEKASEGSLIPALGEREKEPVQTPSGEQERLKCWPRKREMKSFRHLTMSASV